MPLLSLTRRNPEHAAFKKNDMLTRTCGIRFALPCFPATRHLPRRGNCSVPFVISGRRRQDHGNQTIRKKELIFLQRRILKPG